MPLQYYAPPILCPTNIIPHQYYAPPIVCPTNIMPLQYYAPPILCPSNSMPLQYYAPPILCHVHGILTYIKLNHKVVIKAIKLHSKKLLSLKFFIDHPR